MGNWVVMSLVSKWILKETVCPFFGFVLFWVLNWICGSKSLSLLLAFRISIYSMDFCVQPPVKVSLGAEKLLINPSQNVSPLISKACCNLRDYGFKKNFYAPSLPPSFRCALSWLNQSRFWRPSFPWSSQIPPKVSFPLQIRLCGPIKLLRGHCPQRKTRARWTLAALSLSMQVNCSAFN